MESKNKTFKTRNTKNNISVAPLPAKVVAELLDCSESIVKKVRAGNRSSESLIGTKIRVFDDVVAFGQNLLVKEVVERIKLK